MADVKGKLTPAEFLAALKGRKPPAKHIAPQATESIEQLDLSHLPAGPAVLDAESQESAQSDDAANENAGEGISSGHSAYIGHYVKRNSRLSELFDRVNALLGGNGTQQPGQPFRPKAPETLEETGLTFEEIERLILKFLLAKGSGRGRGIANQVRLPFQIVDPILKQLKQEQLVAFKGAAEMGDYDFVITELGRERARRYLDECTYFGAAPVTLPAYLQAMAAQTIAKQYATE